MRPDCHAPRRPGWAACSIVPLALEHCPQVANLHLKNLSTRYRGRPGLRLLEAYYAALVQSDGGSGYVAEQMGPAGARNGVVVGYVCGVWEPAAVRSTLLGGQWLRLAFWTSAQVLIRPRLAIELVGRWRAAAERQTAAWQAYELRPIVVDAAMRRQGIGAQLLAALLADASRRGFRQVHVFAEADNVAANAFYCGTGFHCARREDRRSAARLRYEYTLPGHGLSGS